MRFRIVIGVISAVVVIAALIVRGFVAVAPTTPGAAATSTCYRLNDPPHNDLGQFIADGHHATFAAHEWIVDGAPTQFVTSPYAPVTICVPPARKPHRANVRS